MCCTHLTEDGDLTAPAVVAAGACECVCVTCVCQRVSHQVRQELLNEVSNVGAAPG